MIARSRSEPTNHDCPKCHGHLWRDDEVTYMEVKRERRWWRLGPFCFDDCPEGEHVHRSDRCATCRWTATHVHLTDETMVLPPEPGENQPMTKGPDDEK